MSANVKLTDASLAQLECVALLKTQIPGYKQLALETGLSESYLKNVMSRLVRIKRRNLDVPRETIRKSLMNDADFRSLMESASPRIEQIDEPSSESK